MLELEERVDVVEEKVDRLEILFGHFIAESGAIQKRMEKRAIQMEQRMEQRIVEMEQRWQEQINQAEQRWQQYLAESNAQWEQRAAADKQEWQQRAAADKQEWQRQMAEQHRYWNKRWGELADKMGTIPEDIVAPNIPRLAQLHFGCQELEDIMVRRKVKNKKDPSKRREFDVIAVCHDKVIVNETKSTASVEYIDKFIEALGHIWDYFPEYHGKIIIPIFASLYLGEDIVNYLTKNKIYAMAMGDETMELLNFNRIEN